MGSLGSRWEPVADFSEHDNKPQGFRERLAVKLSMSAY
jgi:hypothetical protein